VDALLKALLSDTSSRETTTAEEIKSLIFSDPARTILSETIQVFNEHVIN